MSEEPGVDTLVIGCGNPMRGDDDAGPAVLRQLEHRVLPPHVRLVDAGTSGIDVALAMRGMSRVVLVDASRLGGEPGTVHRIPGGELVDLAPPPTDLHRFTWDQALDLARSVLGEEYPTEVSVYLVEGASFALGAPLSPEVAAAADRVADAITAELGRPRRHAPSSDPRGNPT